ncbi:ABC transporter substrate-binding protein [Actinopolymorpha sp. B9G3]|uniref:ABC transporter substrate-binding protein n=1 Tax=Actinopolymorpha sp. B9G3 TaxID=3158970 RepID=UPI0032D8C267
MESPHPQLSRRGVLRSAGAGTLLGLSATGCDLLSTDPSSNDRSKADSDSSGPRLPEAPSLTEQVKAGKLPPRKDRMPASPLVVEPTERAGSYGGTWNTCMGNPDASFIYTAIGYDGLVRWNRGWTEVIPNLAEWDAGKDGREYTFHLKPGTRWSDGEPCTADDIDFAYNDVIGNAALFPAFPEWLTAGGRPARVEKVDDRTVRFTFTQPNGVFLKHLASSAGNVLTAFPKHYFEQFHKDYASDADAIAKQEGHPRWSDLFMAKGGGGMTDIAWWQNPDIPTIAAWKATEPLAGNLRLVAERNPYYWKTDPQDSQLPYIDKVVVHVVADPEVAVLQTTEGRYSLVPDEFAVVRDKPVIAVSRKKGGYHFIDVPQSNMNAATFVFNLAHKDPNLRKVFGNKDFRIGLSYALNRREIIDTVLQRQGDPWQTSPLRGSKFYDEGLAKQYTAYDVGKANDHLDRAGYTERDNEGFRLRPDGERLAFTLQVRLGTISTWVDIAELAKRYWERVGVEARVQTGASELVIGRVEANQHDAVMDDGYPGLDDVQLDPTWYFPSHAGCQWAIPWGTWYASRGKEGEEPPAQIRRQMELYDQVKATSDSDRQDELFQQILSIAREEFVIIGTALPVGGYSVVKNTLHNVPSSVPWSTTFPSPGWTNPEQYYIDT